MDLLRRILNSPNKRTLGILFFAAIVLSIPITITLVQQQQDIRQRAQLTEDSCSYARDITECQQLSGCSWYGYGTANPYCAPQSSSSCASATDYETCKNERSGCSWYNAGSANPYCAPSSSSSGTCTFKASLCEGGCGGQYYEIYQCSNGEEKRHLPAYDSVCNSDSYCTQSATCTFKSSTCKDGCGGQYYEIYQCLNGIEERALPAYNSVCSSDSYCTTSSDNTGGTQNSPPKTPQPPKGPSSCAVNTSCTYSITQTSDPDGDRFNTVIDWGDGTVNDCQSDFYPPDTPCEWPHKWTSGGTYCVKARAYDVNQNFSNSSSCLNVTVSGGTTTTFSISGIVFIDNNKNKTLDQGENGLTGVKITIGGGGLSSPTSVTNGSNAFYNASLPTIGLYSLLVTVPNGYILTTPELNPSTFEIGGSISNATVNIGLAPTTTIAPTKTPTQPPPPPPGFCIPGIPGMCPAGQTCNPGTFRCVAPIPTVTPTPTITPTVTLTPTVTMPTATATPGQPTATRAPTATPTISPNEARVAIELLLPGIGSNTALGQNPNPVVRNHTVELQIFNSQNQKVKDSQGTVSYDTQTFSFKGMVSLGPALESGIYIIKARLNNTLRKNLGLANIVAGQTSPASQVKLVPGDLDQNNELNLFDYNMMLSCYGASKCDKKTQADLNIDGKVDEVDLNILYAGFANRAGD